jgi:NADPH-dependent curcumin reductase CurA
MAMNRRILLKQRPKGMPTLDDFELVEAPVPTPGPGEVLVRNRFLSLDPYMRGLMDAGKSYLTPLELGQVMDGATVAEVVASNDPGFAPGDTVWAPGRWQDYAVCKPPPSRPPLRKIDTKLAPPTAWLGPLGLPGWTAYVGLLNLAEPREGQTIVVSSASGAVGGLVGQLAKSRALHTVGIAGGQQKCAYAVEALGFDQCIDYKAEGFAAALAEACPNGIDIDFENVGGGILQAVWPLLNMNARVVVSGLMAQYNLTKPRPGPDLTWLLKQRISIRGFIITDHVTSIPQAIGDMARWLAEGEIKTRDDITVGLERAPAAFIGMLHGKNFGKTLVEFA